jgi:hypothetical protein
MVHRPPCPYSQVIRKLTVWTERIHHGYIIMSVINLPIGSLRLFSSLFLFSGWLLFYSTGCASLHAKRTFSLLVSYQYCGSCAVCRCISWSFWRYWAYHKHSVTHSAALLAKIAAQIQVSWGFIWLILLGLVILSLFSQPVKRGVLVLSTMHFQSASIDGQIRNEMRAAAYWAMVSSDGQPAQLRKWNASCSRLRDAG